MAESEASAEDIEPGEALFNQTTKRFSIWGALKSGLLSGFLVGYHGRLTHRRVQILVKSKIAKELKANLAALTDPHSAHFLGLASVNKEQAEAAFRYTAIINFTAPITLIVVMNQVFPELFPWIFETYLALDSFRLSLVIGLFILATVVPVFQAYVSVGIARDIYHIALIDGARRGSRGGSDHDTGDDDSVGPVDL